MRKLSEKYIYLQVARAIEDKIARKVLCPGDKIPSVRVLMRDAGVSRKTVEKAIDELRRRGVIYTRDRIGHFVADTGSMRNTWLEGFEAGQTEEAMVARLILGGQDRARSFSSAVLETELIPAARIATLAKQAIGHSWDDFVTLELPPGSVRLRRLIAQALRRRGVTCSAEDVLITEGDNTFLRLLLQFLSKRFGAIAHDRICYFGCLRAVEGLTLSVHKLESDSVRGFDTERAIALIEAGRIGMLFLNPTLSNPLGYTLPIEDRRRLVRAAQARDCVIIEDDVFDGLLEGKDSPPPLKAFDETGCVLYLGSLSKVLAPGLRVGWCLPGRFHADLTGKLLSENRCISTPGQRIAERLIGSQMLEDHLKGVRQIFARQRQEILGLIATHFPAGTQISRPLAGGVYWITLPDNVDAERFFAALEAGGIEVSRGTIFGAPQTPASFRLCMTRRLCAATRAVLIEIGEIAARG